jgi:hypothetical protein
LSLLNAKKWCKLYCLMWNYQIQMMVLIRLYNISLFSQNWSCMREQYKLFGNSMIWWKCWKFKRLEMSKLILWLVFLSFEWKKCSMSQVLIRLIIILLEMYYCKLSCPHSRYYRLLSRKLDCLKSKNRYLHWLLYIKRILSELF